MICCGACHADNDDNRRYCGACGVGLIRWCSACSFKNHVTDAYCGGCGTQIAEGPVVQPLARPTAKGPAPALAMAPVPTPAKTTPPGTLSMGDVLAMIGPKPAPTPTTKPLAAKVTQSELDALFGAQ